MEEYVVAVVVDAAERHRQERVRLRSIRDNSNPFEMTETKFRKLFRVPKEGAVNLCETLGDPGLSEGEEPKHIKVLAALNFFTHGSYQAQVGQDSLLGLSQPSISRLVNQTASAIVTELAHIEIKFPITQNEKTALKRG